MTLSSRAVAMAAATACPRLGDAASRGWSDTAIAKVKGVVAIAPRLAFLEGQEFERRAVGRSAEDDPELLELLGLTGKVVRLPEGEANFGAAQTAFEAAVADREVTVILQGVLPGLYGGWHRPDLMMRPAGSDTWIVGEVKVYLDRAGDTPVHLVQSTATQAAVSVVAARRYGMNVSDTATIILAGPRGKPSVRPIDVAGEAELITQLMDRARPPVRDAPLDANSPLAEHRYSPSVCEGACALADVCRAEAGSAPGVLWPGETTAPTYGWKHLDLLRMCEDGSSPAAVQAGWDAAQAALAGR